jgi:hypothetical protein
VRVNLDAVHLVLPLLLLLLGAPLLVIGDLGRRGRLNLTGRVGVRTPAARRSYEAFALANRVAGLPVLVAGGIGVLGAVAALLVPGDVTAVIIAVIALAGTFVVAAAGGSLGNRAAEALPEPAAGGCSGCACGSGGCGAPRADAPEGSDIADAPAQAPAEQTGVSSA